MEKPKTKLERQALQIVIDHFIGYYSTNEQIGDDWDNVYDIYKRLSNGEMLNQLDSINIRHPYDQWSEEFLADYMDTLYRQITYVFENVNEDNLKEL